MMSHLPLPASTAALVEQTPLGERHCGLQLDKYLRPPPKQEQQKDSLAQVCQAARAEALLKDLLARRRRYLASARGLCWCCTTTSSLTLHLARASALENAGICLHPIYGFVYLPGTGLKGMARAYAETVWLRTQADGVTAWRQIEAVFGWAPNSDKDKTWKPASVPKHTEGDEARAGAIVFHDAWPENWPALSLDIVNNHHRQYYAPPDQRSEYPPGDWEEPSMVSFLAIGPGQTFTFALSARREDDHPENVRLAREWLVGALTYRGAGAKTAAGYGGFQLVADPDQGGQLVETVQATWDGALQSSKWADFTCKLELITPAFLAGANQRAEDCDLRPATLRGLLRWWWRTMHAGHVDVATLRRLEAAVWGDTKQGGAVRITVERASAVRPLLYNYRDGFRVTLPFAREHQLGRPPGGRPTTQGLFYASYGMNDGDRQRYYLPAGAAWTVRLVVRECAYEERDAQGKVTRSQPLPAALVLEQARAALWLLCYLGGIGSKARKGFGSLADLPDLTLNACRQAGVNLRAACGLPARLQARLAHSPALDQILSPPTDACPWLEVETFWADPWTALDAVGFAAQGFAQDLAHNPDKRALGLPRQIHGPRREPMPHQRGKGGHRPPQQLEGPHDKRHAAPVFYHLAKKPDGYLLVRVTAFRTPDLPDKPTSERVLGQLLCHLQRELPQRVANSPKQLAAAAATPAPPSGPPSPAVARGPVKRPHGTPATVTLVAKRSKGGFDVQEEGKPQGVLNQGKAPDPLPPVGKTLTVYVYDDARNPVYRWDQPGPPGREGKGRPSGPGWKPRR